jgi:hypothetical protein
MRNLAKEKIMTLRVQKTLAFVLFLGVIASFIVNVVIMKMAYDENQKIQSLQSKLQKIHHYPPCGIPMENGGWLTIVNNRMDS